MSPGDNLPINRESLAEEYADYITRGDLILARVFRHGRTLRTDFRKWMNERVVNYGDMRAVLHEEPFNAVTSFLGIDHNTPAYATFRRKYLDFVKK
jgi:hypothetical protein